jgi:hypothetical protein
MLGLNTIAGTRPQVGVDPETGWPRQRPDQLPESLDFGAKFKTEFIEIPVRCATWWPDSGRPFE